MILVSEKLSSITSNLWCRKTKILNNKQLLSLSHSWVTYAAILQSQCIYSSDITLKLFIQKEPIFDSLCLSEIENKRRDHIPCRYNLSSTIFAVAVLPYFLLQNHKIKNKKQFAAICFMRHLVFSKLWISWIKQQFLSSTRNLDNKFWCCNTWYTQCVETLQKMWIFDSRKF